MKKFFALLVLAFSVTANAGLITVDINETTVNQGETVTLDILGSGFEESDLFYFDLNFDTSIFSFDPQSLTSDLALVDVDAFLFDGLDVEALASGLLFTFSDMFVPVSGDFTIASFSLTAINAGDSQFSLTNIDGFNTDPNSTPSYTTSFSNGSSVSSLTTQVPEPGMFAVFLLSLGLLRLGLRK